MAKQTFTTGQVLTAAQMTDLQQTAMGGGSATAKTASYTLVAADAGATVIMNSASATTITVNTSLFSAGDTVFLQNIGAGVSTVTAGTATVSTASSLALAQYESGTLYFTAAGVSIFSKAAGAAAGGGGKVLQVVSATTTTSTTIATGTFTDTTLTATITPTLATSTILVLVSQRYQVSDASDAGINFRIRRDSTTIGTTSGSGSQYQYIRAAGSTTVNTYLYANHSFLDSPATTSATTYKTQGSTASSAIFQADTGLSSIILMEIGA